MCLVKSSEFTVDVIHAMILNGSTDPPTLKVGQMLYAQALSKGAVDQGR